MVRYGHHLEDNDITIGRNYTKENRTPKEWIKNCIQILQASNPDYILNKNIKGRFIEFYREDNTGIYVSINFQRNKACGSNTYYLCFGLSLSLKRTSYLHLKYFPLPKLGMIGILKCLKFDQSRVIN